jgi:hypothetical protein
MRIAPRLSRAVRASLLIAAAAAATAAPAPAEAGDVTAFVALARPSSNWERGYGATLSSTWFQAINLEGEAARLPGETQDASMTSFTGSALLAPPIGPLTPYGGVGVGVYRQTLAGENDFGTLRALVVGAKLKIGGILVVKGEYRRLTLGDDALIPATDRISAGAGISF